MQRETPHMLGLSDEEIAMLRSRNWWKLCDLSNGAVLASIDALCARLAEVEAERDQYRQALVLRKVAELKRLAEKNREAKAFAMTEPLPDMTDPGALDANDVIRLLEERLAEVEAERDALAREVETRRERKVTCENLTTELMTVTAERDVLRQRLERTHDYDGVDGLRSSLLATAEVLRQTEARLAAAEKVVEAARELSDTLHPADIFIGSEGYLCSRQHTRALLAALAAYDATTKETP